MYYESPKEIYRLPSLILTKKLFCMQHLIILQLKKKNMYCLTLVVVQIAKQWNLSFPNL